MKENQNLLDLHRSRIDSSIIQI